MTPEKPLDIQMDDPPLASFGPNRHVRRAAAAIKRRMLRAGEHVRLARWGSPRSNAARIRFAALWRAFLSTKLFALCFPLALACGGVDNDELFDDSELGDGGDELWRGPQRMGLELDELHPHAGQRRPSRDDLLGGRGLPDERLRHIEQLDHHRAAGRLR